MLAKIALLCYNNYSDKERVIICVLKGILDVCFSVKSAHKSTVIYYGGLFLCHKMLNNKNFRLFRYIVSPEAKASRSDTGSFQAWCRSIFRALLSVSPIDIQSVPPCCGIAGVEVLCSADCCRPVCPAGPFHRSVVLR